VEGNLFAPVWCSISILPQTNKPRPIRVKNERPQTTNNLHFVCFKSTIDFCCYFLQFVVCYVNPTACCCLNWRTSTRSTESYHKIHSWQFQFKICILGESMVLWLQWSVFRKPLEVMQNNWAFWSLSCKVWTIGNLATESWEDGRKVTLDMIIPCLSNKPAPAIRHFSGESCHALQFESGDQHHQQKTSKSQSKAQWKHKANDAVKVGTNG